jgi:hypothetical protein
MRIHQTRILADDSPPFARSKDKLRMAFSDRIVWFYFDQFSRRGRLRSKTNLDSESKTNFGREPKTNLDRRRSTSAGMGKAVFHAHAHLEVKRWRVRETATCCGASD